MSTVRESLGYELVGQSKDGTGYGFVVEWLRSSFKNGYYFIAAVVWEIDDSQNIDDNDRRLPPFEFYDHGLSSVARKSLLDGVEGSMRNHDPYFRLSMKWDGCTELYMPAQISALEPDNIRHTLDLMNYLVRKATAYAKVQPTPTRNNCDQPILTEGDIEYYPPEAYTPPAE